MLRRFISCSRRDFLSKSVAGAAAIGTLPAALKAQASPTATVGNDYDGPNVVIIRFGGGARRRETIDSDAQTYCPYLLHELAPQGTLYRNMLIDTAASETGHGQGTLNILTGKYDKYQDVGQEFLGERFEAKVPTVFEYLRSGFDVPEHQTLLVNGEDRTQEEFYTFSNHHLFGARFRSNVLSLYRFKTYLLRRQIADEPADWSEEQLKAKQQELVEMEALDYRLEPGKSKQEDAPSRQSAELDSFWVRWRKHYGDSGLVNPRGDALLTELTVRAITELRPKLVMVNYNDCDYVHWGNMAHYTRAISFMDAGIRRIVQHTQADEHYRDNTVFVIVPDCGRDDSRFAAVPCQHHFNTKSSREIFCLVVGAGIAKGQVVDRPAQQIQVAASVGQLMGFNAAHAEGEVLAEALA